MGHAWVLAVTVFPEAVTVIPPPAKAAGAVRGGGIAAALTAG